MISTKIGNNIKIFSVIQTQYKHISIIISLVCYILIDKACFPVLKNRTYIILYIDIHNHNTIYTSLLPAEWRPERGWWRGNWPGRGRFALSRGAGSCGESWGWCPGSGLGRSPRRVPGPATSAPVVSQHCTAHLSVWGCELGPLLVWDRWLEVHVEKCRMRSQKCLVK